MSGVDCPAVYRLKQYVREHHVPPSPEEAKALIALIEAAREVEENCISTDDYSSHALLCLSIALDTLDAIPHRLTNGEPTP